MKKLFFLTLTFYCCHAIFATTYPITPRPLRKLVMESDAAIVGRVISITDKVYEGKKKKNVYYRPYKVAKIVVVEVLKGDITNDTIQILFDPNMSCPFPAIYYEKTTPIAFLDVKNGNYTTHALSYGVKTLDSTGISIYKKRINEIQEIIKIPDSVLKKRETIEWLVKCAENEVTSWEGTYELNNYKEFTNDPDNDFKMNLTEDQKTRLKKACFSSNQISYFNFSLSDLIYDENKFEIDSYLLEKLKKLPKEDYYHADEYISRLKHKNYSEEMQKLLKRYYEIRLDFESTVERDKIITEFIKLVEK